MNSKSYSPIRVVISPSITLRAEDSLSAESRELPSAVIPEGLG